MATQLTWRNVDAPDFRGVNDGFRTASQLLSNAASGWNDQRVTDDRLAASALNQQQLQGRIGQENYLNNRLREDDALSDAASPAVAALSAAARTGDPIAIAALERDPTIQRLRAGQSLALNTTLGNQTRNAVATDAGRLNTDIAAYDFNNARTARADQEALLPIINEIQSTAGTPADALGIAEKYRGNLTPTQQAMLMKAVPGYGPVVSSGSTPATKALSTASGGVLPGSVGSNGVSLAVSNPGTAGTKDGSAWDTVVGFGQFGKPEKPVSSMTVGEAIKFGKDVLIPATRDNAQLGLSGGKGTSAIGAFQFTQETLADFAPKVLGKDWETQPMTPENQDKLGKAIFEARKDGNLKSTWASLPDATPGAYKNKTWSEVRKDIAQREVGKDIGDTVPAIPALEAQRAAAGDLATTLSQQTNTGIVADLDKAQKSTETLRQVAERMRGKGGDLEGWSLKEAMNRISSAATDSGMSPAVGGAILSRSLQAPNSDGGWWDVLPWVDNKVRVNDAALKENITQVRNGGANNQALAVAGTQEDAATLEAARAAAIEARSAANAIAEAAKTRPGITGLAAAQKKADDMNVLYQGLLEQSRTKPQRVPVFKGNVEAAAAIKKAAQQEDEQQAGTPASTIFRRLLNGPDR